MSTRVEADRTRVWEALTDCRQWARWRPGLLEPIGSPAPEAGQRGPAPLEPGQCTRWRCHLQDLPLVLAAVPRELVPGVRLVTELRLGLFRFQETFTLAPTGNAPCPTRLSLKIMAPNEMPVVGGVIDRFAVRRFATELAANYLQAVRDWCEGSGDDLRGLPPLPPASASAVR